MLIFLLIFSFSKIKFDIVIILSVKCYKMRVSAMTGRKKFLPGRLFWESAEKDKITGHNHTADMV